MSAIAIDPENDNTLVQPVFTDAARWLAAIVLITSLLLQAIEFLLETGSDDNAARVAFWAAHPGQAGLSVASGLLAVPFLLGGSAALVALTQAGSRRLSWMGGAFMAFGLFYAISPSHQRQGYSTKAASAIVQYAFQHLLLGRVVATTEYDNAASMGVMRKIGMRIEQNPLAEPPWLHVVGILENPSIF